MPIDFALRLTTNTLYTVYEAIHWRLNALYVPDTWIPAKRSRRGCVQYQSQLNFVRFKIEQETCFSRIHIGSNKKILEERAELYNNIKWSLATCDSWIWYLWLLSPLPDIKEQFPVGQKISCICTLSPDTRSATVYPLNFFSGQHEHELIAGAWWRLHEHVYTGCLGKNRVEAQHAICDTLTRNKSDMGGFRSESGTLEFPINAYFEVVDLPQHVKQKWSRRQSTTGSHSSRVSEDGCLGSNNKTSASEVSQNNVPTCSYRKFR